MSATATLTSGQATRWEGWTIRLSQRSVNALDVLAQHVYACWHQMAKTVAQIRKAVYVALATAGGHGRAKSLTAIQRSKIARKAARARWRKEK